MKKVEIMAARCGLLCRTYAPGDGIVRYRFFRGDRNASELDYFGPVDGIYTALGPKQAMAFLAGFAAANDLNECDQYGRRIETAGREEDK